MFHPEDFSIVRQQSFLCASSRASCTIQDDGNRLFGLLQRLRKSTRCSYKHKDKDTDMRRVRLSMQGYDCTAFPQHTMTDEMLVDTSAKVVVTRSKPSDLPSALRAKRSEVQTITSEDVQQDATIRQTCEKCGQEEVRYYTQQLRSADEGSTVFYTCPSCGHKWNTNN